MAESELVERFVGPSVERRDEVNGYWFWALVALFIGVPETTIGSHSSSWP